MNRSRSHCLFFAGLLVLAAFAVRAVSLDAQSLWRDEVDALRFATVPWSEIFSSFARPGWNGPLYYLLLRGWIALAGTSEYAMRFFSLVFGVLCVPLVYALGRRLFDRQTGSLAALLVTASPYLAWYSQEAKMYALISFLTLLATYSLRRAVEEEKGWHWWTAQLAATSLAFYSHILAALLIPVQVLVYFTWWPQARKRWGGALVSLALLTLPYLPLVAWQVPQVLQARQTGFDYFRLDEMARILLNGWSLGILGWDWGAALVHALASTRASISSWEWPWGIVLMSALAVWGLLSPALPLPRKRGLGWGRSRLALLCWLVTPLLAVWLISLRQPLFTDRYLIWCAPAFYLLVALGLAFFWRSGSWGRAVAALLVGGILISNGANLWQQATVPIKSDFRAAAAYVANYQAPGKPHRTRAPGEEYSSKSYLPLVMADRLFNELIIFQIPHGRHTFDYYFPEGSYPWAEGLYTNHRVPDGFYLMSEQEAARQMQQVTAGHHVIWLVATEMAMWDERGLIRAWLEENAELVGEAHFTRVDVYRYAR
jgi:mannosyltransferase